MLTDFQKRKLALEFLMYDADGDGVVEKEDVHTVGVELARMYGWTEGSEEFERLTTAYDDVWNVFWSPADQDNDGRVNLDERMVAGEYFVGMPEEQAREAAQPVLTAVFSAMDADNDGFISVDEWRKFLRANRIDDAAIDEALRNLDVDDDGKISLDELSDMMFGYYTAQDQSDPANWIYAMP